MRSHTNSPFCRRLHSRQQELLRERQVQPKGRHERSARTTGFSLKSSPL